MNTLRVLLSSCLLSIAFIVRAQVNENKFYTPEYQLLCPPGTTMNPMSIKLWDNYANGGPTDFGTVMEIYGLANHQTSQLYFGGWDNSNIRYRQAFYVQNTWSD